SFPESEVCNLLDFLRNPDDGLMARQIASVMNRNFALNSHSSEDKFFSDAGDQLVQAILMLTKSLPAPDLMTASTLLSLSDLPARIQAAWDNPNAVEGWEMSNWVYMAFAQLLQLQGSEKTVAGVLGTASKLFSRFLNPELVSAFCGETTLPIDMEGKTLMVLGMDRQRRSAIAPLIATVMHMVVTRNVTRKRRDPLILGIDELPTLFLPYLTNWLNEDRSDGLVTVIGFQNLNQLEKAYSRETSRAIFGGCGTKTIFNPQEAESARVFSDYLGNEEISITQKSKNTGRGGTSKSTSDHLQQRPLIEPAQFNRYPTGKCAVVNPGYANKKEAALPFEIQIKIPKADIQREAWCRNVWEKVRGKLIAQSGQTEFSDERSREAIQYRRQIVEQFFPNPGNQEVQPSAPIPLSPDVMQELKAVF
ncbi:MAG: TraM recognition domain-containing protein, partial [Cyanobacteria bacterium J06638_22]